MEQPAPSQPSIDARGSVDSSVPPTEQVTLSRRIVAEPGTAGAGPLPDAGDPLNPEPWPPPDDRVGRGETVVADSVVAQVAATAARSVAGVHELTSRSGGDPLLRLIRRIAGPAPSRIPGVTVKAGSHDVTILLTLTVTYGAGIPGVVDGVRSAVTHQVQTLTGLTVREVKIEVVALHLPERADRSGST